MGLDTKKISFILSAIALVGVSFLVTPWALDPLEIDKVMLVRALGAMAAIALISKKGMVWIKRMDVGDPGFWLLVFVGWSAFSTMFSTNVFRSVFGSMLRGGGLITLASVLLLYIGLRSAGPLGPRARMYLARAATASAAGISLLAIAQFITRSYIVTDIMPATTGEPYQLIRVAGTFGHPLYLGMYLALMCPFVWFAFTQEKRRSIQFLVAGAGMLILSAIYLSRSRIALLACAVLCGILMWKHVGRYKRTIGALIVGVIITLMLIPSVRHTVARPQSLFVRTQEWQFATEHILKRPFFGYGFETYDAVSITRDRHPAELKDGVSDRVHNIWLDTAFAIGLPGMIALAMVFFALYKKNRKATDEWTQASAMALLIYLILMQTSFDHGATYAIFPFLLAQLTTQASHVRVSKKRVVLGATAGMIILLPLVSNALQYYATQYMVTGEYKKEISIYQTARLFSPTWPEIDVKEAEAWYGLAIMEPASSRNHIQKAHILMSHARAKGLPWYAHAAFETKR